MKGQIFEWRSYINFIMNIPQDQTLKKSQTHSFALPNINKARLRLPVNYKTSQSAAKTRQHNSVFLQKIKDMTKDTKYEEMETSSITQEQKQLKQVIRDFNQETYHILGRYLDKASMAVTDRKDLTSQTTEMRKSSRTRNHSVSMMAEVQEKQIFNSNEAIQICKKQLMVLEKRSENLKYVTTEEFSRKIEATREEIETQKQVIKQILRQNTRKGLEIKRQDDAENHEVSMLEYEKYILEKKKQRLQNDTKYVNEQESKLKQKHTEGDKKIQQMNMEYEKLSNQDKNTREQVQMKKKLQQKRRELFYKKQKKEMLGATSKKQNKQGEKSQIMNGKEKTQKIQQKKQTASKSPIKSSYSITMKKGNTSQIKFQPPPSAATVNKYQHQYLKLLKQLDEVMNRNKSHEENMSNTSQRNEECKIQIQAYEQKLAALKKKSLEIELSKVKESENDKNKSGEKKGFLDSLFG